MGKMPQVTELEEGAPIVHDGSDNTDSDSDDDVPETEDATVTGQSQVAAAAGLPEELVSKAKQSRGEKKARKSMSKLGLKQVVGVSPHHPQVEEHLVRHQQARRIQEPSIRHLHCLRRGQIEDLNQQAHMAAVEKFKAPELNPAEAGAHGTTVPAPI